MGFGGGGVGACQIKWPSRENIPKIREKGCSREIF